MPKRIPLFGKFIENRKMKTGHLALAFLFLSAFLSIRSHSQDPLSAIRKKIGESADKLEDKCIAWRRDIHANPELGNREKRTASIVADHLRKLGLEVKEGVAVTGVVGILKGSRPGPCIALRADMDALPIEEKTDLPFASKVRSTYEGQEVGVMHACGHDAHVAMLLTAAEILSGMKNEIKGTVKFIFQPAEEGPPSGEKGGAELMVEENVMENPKVEAIFGLHIEAEIEKGWVKYKPGAFMASSDWFSVTVKGKGSHGSKPWTGIDPIQVSAQIIEGLQAIVSRQSDLTKAPVVITVGTIHGGVRNNIIPEECTFGGTIRTLSNESQKDVHNRIKWTVEKIAEASHAKAEVKFDTKTLVTYNDPELVKRMIPSLQAAAGEKYVAEMNWDTGAEDFSYYGTKAPAFFFYLGGMKPGRDIKNVAPHHTSKFEIDESSMKTGVKVFCNLVFDYLK